VVAVAPVRVLIVAESFLPVVNGVVNSVLRILEHLRDTGHEAMVVAPARSRSDRRRGLAECTRYAGFPVVRVPAVEIPVVNSLPLGLPTRTVVTAMRDFAPDVVHLASPFVLGGGGAWAARRLGVPYVAVYQTDVPGFAAGYGLGPLTAAAWQVVRMIHNPAAMTLAPSSATSAELERHGVRNVRRWARGVRADRFSPEHRSAALRARWTGGADLRVVGYVGRLASEKSVHRLAALSGRPGLRLVVVGDGPQRGRLERLLPDAVFTGELHGEELSAAVASLDVFVHTGEFETFCQALQEALASGVPAVAPAAGGPLDLVADHVTGRLLPVESFGADLPAAVDELLGASHARFCRRARESVLARTWPALCGQLVEYYRSAARMS
jgi:phosphatidylinositol alpha 1,6-mannosyltransferase